MLVLEARDRIGGACTLEHPFEDPGFVVSPCAYLVGLLHHRVIDELDLRRHGYRVHLVDPLTGRPGCRAASATVTGPSLALADALATALAVGGDAALAAVAGLPGYAAYLIRPDGTETWTDGLQWADPEISR